MLDHGQRDDDLLADTGFVEIGHRAALHEAVGQVIGKVAHPGQAELLERLLQLRPDAFEALGFGEQRVERLGAHGRSYPRILANCEQGNLAPLANLGGQGLSLPAKQEQIMAQQEFTDAIALLKADHRKVEDLFAQVRERAAATERSSGWPRRSAPS